MNENLPLAVASSSGVMGSSLGGASWTGTLGSKLLGSGADMVVLGFLVAFCVEGASLWLRVVMKLKRSRQW
jgi:hypothetical protein